MNNIIISTLLLTFYIVLTLDMDESKQSVKSESKFPSIKYNYSVFDDNKYETQTDNYEGDTVWVDDVSWIGYRIIIQDKNNGSENRFAKIDSYNLTAKTFMFSIDIPIQDYVGFSPEISDLNNDGQVDLLIQNGETARGANLHQSLLVYEGNGVFNWIKNSNKFPNMKYNSMLNCIDSWAIYGGCSTSFLKIKNDILIEFAYVTSEDGVVSIYEQNEMSEFVCIQKDSMRRGYDFPRFKNYKPLIYE